MLSRLRAMGLLWPLVLALLGLAVLLSLGAWQMQRRTWKAGLIAKIEARTRAEPVPLAEAYRRFRAGSDIEYLRVRIDAPATLQHGQERWLYMPDQRLGPGVHVYTPATAPAPPDLQTQGTSGFLVLVNRGYVPDRLKDQTARPPAAFKGLVGLVRLPEPRGRFTPPFDAKAKLHYQRDPAAMLGALDVAGHIPLPFSIDAEAEPANPGGWPKGGTTLLRLPNRHLEYALTWFGLALTLVGVFAMFAWSRLQAGREG